MTVSMTRGFVTLCILTTMAVRFHGGKVSLANEPQDAAAASVRTDAARLPRDNLLVYRGGNGEVLPVKSVDDWQKRRAEIVRGMETVMGKLPGDDKRCLLDMKVEEEVDCGSYVRRLITYASEPGSRVPAYLCVPKSVLEGKGRAPAVLCLHGTDNVVGHGVVVGIGGKPNRQYASELAERGYVTFAPNYPLLAKYQPNLKELGWESGTLKAVWDNMRGMDLLESLPYVKPGGFGTIGHSLGGHNSIYTAVLDTRIKAIASSCGFDSYLDYYGGDEKNWFPERGWCQTRYMLRLADYRGRLEEIPFDFHELIGALAPRHVFVSAPLRDSNFRHDSVDRIIAAATPVFKLHGHADRLRVEHPDCEHDFPDAMRTAAYEMFDKVLDGGKQSAGGDGCESTISISEKSESVDYRWVQVTGKAAFAPRDGAGALTFRGKMWLLGGWNPGDKKHFPLICNNEVWSSSDGVAWTLEKPNTFLDRSFNPTSDWEGRHTAGYVVFKDKLWIIGGDANQGHYQNDVWNSADGRTWNLVSKDSQLPWAPRALHYTLVFQDKIWVIGGQTMPAFAAADEVFYRDIWNSSDGIHWQQVTPREPYWSPRGMIGGSVVFKDRIWILGGGTYDTPKTPRRNFYNDVWSSADGVTWQRHVEHAAWEPRQYHEVAVFDDRMWVLEGYHKANRNDVWHSADGVTWHELPNTPWKPRHAASVFVHNNALWMVAGNNMESDVWKLVRFN